MILDSRGWPQGCAQPYFYILDDSTILLRLIVGTIVGLRFLYYILQ